MSECDMICPMEQQIVETHRAVIGPPDASSPGMAERLRDVEAEGRRLRADHDACSALRDADRAAVFGNGHKGLKGQVYENQGAIAVIEKQVGDIEQKINTVVASQWAVVVALVGGTAAVIFWGG